MATIKRPRRAAKSLVEHVLDSPLYLRLAPDAAGAIALGLIGVSIYRFSPDLVWGYVGLLVLIPSIAVAHARASAAKAERKAD